MNAWANCPSAGEHWGICPVCDAPKDQCCDHCLLPGSYFEETD